MVSLLVAALGLLACSGALADTKVEYARHDRVPIVANKVRFDQMRAKYVEHLQLLDTLSCRMQCKRLIRA